MSAPHSGETRAAAVADYLAGYSSRDVAEMHDVGASTVLAWVKAAGHEARPCVTRTKSEDEHALTGGAWVADGRGIMRWEVAS